MNILHTNFLPYMVGEARRILTVSLGLQEKGHTVFIATPCGSQLAELAGQEGLKVISSVEFKKGFRPLSFIKDIYYLHKTIKENQLEIIHTHGSTDSWTGSLAAFISSNEIKVIRTRHNHFPVKRHFANKLLYKKLTDKVIVISEYIFGLFTQDGFFSRQEITLIHSSVDVNKYHPENEDPKRFKNELKIAEHEKLVGIIAFMVPRKGHTYFIAAAEKILKSGNHNVKFVIVGDGEDKLEASLKEKVRQAGLEELILFTGYRSDVISILAGLDILVYPTLNEALGLGLVEALSMKTPVVASEVGGIPEIVRHMKTGLLVPPHNAEKLSEAIQTLLADDTLAFRLAENGRKLVENQFSVEVMVEKTEEAYHRLLKGNVP